MSHDCHAQRWWRLGRLADLPGGVAVKVEIDESELALVRTSGDGLFLVGGRCLHQDGPLFDGAVDATTITCPLHRWQYDLATGRRRDQPGSAIATYPVRARDGWVEATLPGWSDDHARAGDR